MMIRVEGTITEKEHAAAQRLHQKPRPAFAWAGILLLIVALVVLWLAFFGPYSHKAAVAPWAILAFLIYLLLHWAVVLPLKWRRIYKQQQSLHRPFSLEITDDGISGESENLQGATPWSDYVRWKEGNGVFLLYWSDVLFQIIPFRFFKDDEQMREFRNILSQKVAG
jgi:hypothetical protein